jgi:hypothetical protein
MKPKLGLCTLVLAIVVSMVNVKSIASAGEEKEAKEDEYYRNRILLGIGNTHEHGENGLTGALSYTHVVHRLIGIGALLEYAGGDFDRTIAAFRLRVRAKISSQNWSPDLGRIWLRRLSKTGGIVALFRGFCD